MLEFWKKDGANMNKVRGFAQEVQNELKKVIWPTRTEVKDAAIVVVICTVLLGCFIGVVDFIFSRVISFLIR